jgi:cell division septation protein DedD
MAEIRRGFGGEGLGNERLPWLEPVEDEDDFPETGGDGGRVALWIVVGLVALAIAFGAFVIWQRHSAATADIGQIIHAPPGPYKEKPANPGGLQVSEGDVIASRMGTGNDIDSPIDLSKVPEQPLASRGGQAGGAPTQSSSTPAAAGTPATPAPAPAAKTPPHPAFAYAPPTAASAPVVKAPPTAPAPKVPAEPARPAAPAAPTAGGSGTIQLGALASEAKAKQVWKSLSTRFAFLQPLNMSITPVKVGDNTLYRLRASGGDARALCARLRIAGESCNVVD